ncbi:hypothetical protein PMAYCL1PPCAC_11303, partial [Pristionchus mayeri]
LLLVAAPSLVMIGMGWKLFTLDDKAVALAYSATAYICFIALELGELINSLSFLLTGAGRLETLYAGQMYTPITVHDCFYKKYWPHSLILGTQIPTLFLILTSAERIVAVCCPAQFNRVFTMKKKAFMIVFCSLQALKFRDSGKQALRRDTKTNILIAFTGKFKDEFPVI